MKTSKSKADVYQLVTDRIIEALEQGTIPWRKTWAGAPYARNYVTKHTYHGINALLTNLSPYDLPYFVTLKQANQLGGKVKKGAKSIPIVYWKIIFKNQEGNVIPEKESKGRKDLNKLFFARYYRVFNISEIEGVSFKLPEAKFDHDRIENCEQLIQGIKNPPIIQHGGNQAYYAPPIDHIQMPELNQFESPEAYYATLWHELIHATGHVSRLCRDEVMGTVKFGSPIYSQEELTAEIGAAFLCNLVEIENTDTFTNAASYIQGWLSKLKDDKRFIIRAASKAKAAVEYLTQ
ncbi:MAG: zincin-like metallopeptidase domain-containing protein [Bacteroidota bacterium]